MIYVVYVVGVLMCASGLVGLVLPGALTQVASRVAASKPLRVTAVVVRILFGAIAIIVSNATPYPLVMKIIGVLAIMAGTIVGIAGKDTLNRWVASFKANHNACRVMSLAALAMGAFLVHATT